jgi:hypothetical protein
MKVVHCGTSLCHYINNANTGLCGYEKGCLQETRSTSKCWNSNAMYGSGRRLGSLRTCASLPILERLLLSDIAASALIAHKEH